MADEDIIKEDAREKPEDAFRGFFKTTEKKVPKEVAKDLFGKFNKYYVNTSYMPPMDPVTWDDVNGNIEH